MPTYLYKDVLHGTVEGPVNDIKLLLPGQFIKINGITGYADRKLRIFLRMLHRINQMLPVEYVNVQMMSAACRIAVKQGDEIGVTGLLLLAECFGTMEKVLEMPSRLLS